MAKLLCRLVGHKPPVYAERGWWSPGQEYARLRYPIRDGLNRVHLEVWAECARCEEQFRVCRVHCPFPVKEADFREQ